MPADLSKLPQSELLSLADQTVPAGVLADAMQLNGAGVMVGDVISSLVRLGLRFVSVDDGDPGASAKARLKAITETQPCSCGSVWMRLTDDDRGWWHRNGIDSYDYTRKCRDDGRRESHLATRRQRASHAV
jgi:hypothetical protein